MVFDACNELGLLAWEGSRLGRARLNETANNVDLWTRTRDLAHSLDDSRQTTGALHGGHYNTTEFVQDVFSFNDYSRDGGHAALRPPRTAGPGAGSCLGTRGAVRR